MSIKMFTNAKVGDKVWDMKYKHGVIISTNCTREIPICVKFDSGQLRTNKILELSDAKEDT